MSANWTVAPVFAPLLAGLLLLLLGRAGNLRRGFALAAAAGQTILAAALLHYAVRSGGLSLALGGWSAPYGIILVLDPLAAIMTLLAAIITLASLAFGFFTGSAEREHPLRLPLVMFLASGINLAFITGDLFNLFVAFEVMLLASYALLTLESDDYEVKHAFPYVAVNMTGSALFLLASGFAYGAFGTLNLAELGARMAANPGDPRVSALAALLLVVFGIKAGIFPLYYWLPHSYPTLPGALAALYSGLLTKVGVYVLIRMTTAVFPHELVWLHHALAWLAAATMLFGVLGAVSRTGMRGVLSFHILSQIGFMVLALGLFTPLAIAAAIFYVIHHIVVKATLFLTASIVSALNRTDELAQMGRIWRAAPWAGAVFLLQALSLAGLPPLSGFWGKYLILVEALRLEAFVLAFVALVASALTLFSMLKIWNAAFFGEREPAELRIGDDRWRGMTWIAGALTALSLAIGLGAEFVFDVARAAADQALDRGAYWRLSSGGAP